VTLVESEAEPVDVIGGRHAREATLGEIEVTRDPEGFVGCRGESPSVVLVTVGDTREQPSHGIGSPAK